jgi:preprotein translocase subunit SecE
MERYEMATDKKAAKPALIAMKEKAKAKSASGRRARRFNPKKTALAIGRFFRDVVSEMKKVTWASRKEFISYTVAVIVFVVTFGLIIFSMDWVLQHLPQYIATLNS